MTSEQAISVKKNSADEEVPQFVDVQIIPNLREHKMRH